MANLDDINAIRKLDSSQMEARIAELPDQLEAAWFAFKDISIPTHYVQARNMVILGMGASAIGGELAAVLAEQSSSIPIEIRRDYDVPSYVNKDSIVIGVSYSGNTEETLDGFLKAAGKGAKLIAITTGGELASLGRKFQIPIYSVDYGATPRATFGYLFTAVVAILSRLRHFELSPDEIPETAVLMRALHGKIKPDVPLRENLAKTIATKLKDKIPVIIGAGALAPVARRWKTQFNENGKLVAFTEQMPELCHNLIVSLDSVYHQRDHLATIILQSSFSHARNQLRTSIVGRQITNSKIQIENIVMHPSGTILSEALQMVMLGDYISFYLGIQANVDPASNIPIDQLKKELAGK